MMLDGEVAMAFKAGRRLRSVRRRESRRGGGAGDRVGSRRTDIPTFYRSGLFGNCKRVCRVVEPVQSDAAVRVVRKTRAVVFWTKNPRPLMPFLSALNELEIGYYLQFTLTTTRPKS